MLVPEPRTLLERKLDAFTAAIRDTIEWWTKLNETDVVERWRSEAAEQDIDDDMFNFAMQQLRHQAGQCDELGVRPSPVPGVFESEQLLGTELLQQLLAGLKPLEDVPDKDKDWHPGSNKQVLDVVHPSLFPLVYGLSRTTTSARPPPPRNGHWHDATFASPPPRSATDALDAHGVDVNDDSDDLEDLWGIRQAGHREFAVAPDAEADEEEDGEEGILLRRMVVGGGQSEAERANAAAAAATAPCWHTPVFNEWKTAMGSGTPIAAPPAKSLFVSARFQCLPADVLVGAGGRVVFDSYVNNMHPERHAALYAATARLLERALPLFERTLAASTRLPERVAQFNRDGHVLYKWWLPDYDQWLEALKKSEEMPQLRTAWMRQLMEDAEVPTDDAAMAEAAAVDEEYDAEELYENQIHALYQEQREWRPATLPATYEPPPPPPPLDLKRRRLQVIVEYAEIVLTPERPGYGGGVWHVGGMENEAIVASCVACLAADNISESRLHFCSMVSDPECTFADVEDVQRMYGILDESRLNDPLGSVLCAPGRMLCWPNALPHRVAPFELADASRPGVRKIALLSLVDPRFRVLSTRDVPPQQLAWHDAESRLGSVLPVDVKRKVDALREFPISLERAKALRLELMEERE